MGRLDSVGSSQALVLIGPGWLPASAMECAAKGLAAEPCAGGVADRRCGGCGAVAYCSRAHQVGHTIYSTLPFEIQARALEGRKLAPSRMTICGTGVVLRFLKFGGRGGGLGWLLPLVPEILQKIVGLEWILFSECNFASCYVSANKKR